MPRRLEERPDGYACNKNGFIELISNHVRLTDNTVVSRMGRGGSLVDSTPFVRRVAGSYPALAAT